MAPMQEIALRLLSFSSAETTQINIAANKTLPTEPWYHNYTLLTLILTGILVVIGIVTFVIIIVFREKRHFEGICKSIGKITPDDFDVSKPKDLKISEQEYIRAFAQRPEDRKVRDAIEKDRSILILGKPLQGKSREAFQILYEMRKKFKDFWFVRPKVKREVGNVPKKKKVVIFFDDLNKYADERFGLTDFLRNFKNKIVIATCRTGAEHRMAYEKFLHEIEQFEVIRLESIDQKEAGKLAQRTNRTLEEFDGTPGSILLGLNRIKQKIEGLSEEQKAVLQTMKLLAFSYIYFPEIKVVKGVSEDIFQARGINFEDNLRLLIETGLIIKHNNILRIWHDRYFEFINLYFEIEYLAKLRRTLFRLKEPNSLISLSAWYGINELHDEAIETCNMVIKLNPKDAETFNNRGNVYFHKRQLERAIDNYNKAIELNPKFAQAFNNRGFAYAEKGEFNKAIEDYNRAIELDPKNAMAFYNRGLAYGYKVEFDRAIEDYTKAIELNPKDAKTFNNRGNVYAEKGEFNKAIEDYNRVIELDPKDAIAFYNRGLTYAKKGEFDRAIEGYNRAIELHPKYAEAFNNRGNAYAKKGDFDRALEDFNKAIELNPNNAETFNNRGNAYANKGNFGRAIEDHTKAIKLNPKYVVAFYNRGNSYFHKRKLDSAIEDCTKAIELDPKYALAMVVLGLIYRIKKDKENAKHWFEQALKYKDQFPDKGEQVLQGLKELEKQ